MTSKPTQEPAVQDEWQEEALPLHTRLNGFRIEDLLGKGGFGIVYLARHEESQSLVAIKEYLPPELAVRRNGTVRPRSTEVQATYDDGLRRFSEEAQRLIEFQDHPNIVSCRDFFRINGTAYLVMDFVDGLPLSELLRRRESRGDPLGERELLAIAVPLLDGIKRVHGDGVLHRDVKPSNILIRKADEQPVLIDFGAAKQIVAAHTKSLAPYTDGFAALEQVADGKLGPWTDMYGLGAVLWRIVAGGNPPWEPLNPVKVERRANASLRQQPDPLPPATKLGAKRFSKKLLKAIDRCLALNRADRVQGSGDLLHDFQMLGKTRSDRAMHWLHERAVVMLAWAISAGVWKPNLHDAAFYGRVNCIRALVSSGTDVNVRNDVGSTALHWAVRQGHIVAVESLLNAGADLFARDQLGDSPLHDAAYFGKPKVIAPLVEAGIDPDDRNSGGSTPLHRAAQRGHTLAIHALLDTGADVLAHDKRGFSPLHAAAYSGKPNAIAALLEAGADLLARDNKHGFSPVHYAARFGKCEAIAVLIEAGADPDDHDSGGRTPLHRAAQRGHTLAVEALLDAGADVLARDKDGNCPLHFAASSGSLEAVGALIRADADPAARNFAGRTPRRFAIDQGHTGATKVLRKASSEGLTREKEGIFEFDDAA